MCKIWHHLVDRIENTGESEKISWLPWSKIDDHKCILSAQRLLIIINKVNESYLKNKVILALSGYHKNVKV